MVDGFALHWYTGDHFDAVRLTKEHWGKEIWFTEGCVEYSRFDGMTPLQKAEMYAHDILGNLNAGICGSIDWNLLLDAKGGPNHVGNFCEAPVMLHEDASDFSIMTEYYYIGQFSRFIRSGAVCLGSSSYSANVEATVFDNPDGERVAVLLNRTDDAQSVSLTENAADAFSFTLDPTTIATVQWKLTKEQCQYYVLRKMLWTMPANSQESIIGRTTSETFLLCRGRDFWLSITAPPVPTIVQGVSFKRADRILTSFVAIQWGWNQCFT